MTLNFLFQSLALLENDLDIKLDVLNVLQHFSKGSGRDISLTKFSLFYQVFYIEEIRFSSQIWNVANTSSLCQLHWSVGHDRCKLSRTYERFLICDDKITENDRCVIKIIGIHCTSYQYPTDVYVYLLIFLICCNVILICG